MSARRTVGIVAFVVAVVFAACSGGDHSRSASTSTSRSPTTASRVQNLTVTAADKQALTTAFVDFKSIPAGDIAGTRPGSVYAAYVPSTGKYWAVAQFDPSAHASERTLINLQDGGQIGIFVHKAGTEWTMVSPGSLPFCPSLIVPDDVLAAWGMTDDQSCSARPPTTR